MTSTDAITKLPTRINYKVIAIIASLSVVDIVYNLYFFDGSYFDIKDGIYLAGIAGCGISSILVAKKYHGSAMLEKAYLFLGLGFFAWFIADVGYYYNEFVLEIDPWPSPFDLGFLANYVFAILHLGLNTKYFKPKWSNSMKAPIVVIPIIAVFIFTITAYDSWGEYDGLVFDIVYSNLFVIGAAVMLALVVVGASVFRTSVLKSTWLLLLIGILFWVVADSAYYYLETIEAYTHNSPIKTLWMISFMLIIYALYKHHKVL